jgi:RNA 3'-terminal phosphate cyclase (ATP)
MIEIDGSHGEGGGQVLRTALALSAWLGRPFQMKNIRARRMQPGLKAQHLAAVELVARVCGATVEGAALRSGALRFSPGAVAPGTYEQEVGTAGATTLVAQAAAIPLLRAPGPSRLRIGGGTHVAWAPPADYLRDVYARLLSRMGLRLQVDVTRHGFFPRGGGCIEVEVGGARSDETGAVSAIRLERPPRHQIRIEATAVVSSLPRTIAERMLATACRMLGERHWRARERIVETAGPTGTYLFIRVFSHADSDMPDDACILGGFTGLGELRKPAEAVGQEAAGEALAFLQSEAALDCRLADQVLLSALVAGCQLTFHTDRLSQHLRTQAETIAHFLGPCVRLASDGKVSVGRPQ